MRLVARYAKDLGEAFEVVTVYDGMTETVRLGKDEPVIKTIATKHPAAIWFERKMRDDFGIRIDGAFDNRPLVHQERFPKDIHPMRKDFSETVVDFADYTPYKYEAIGGDGVFEVAVGPIHAGIIEPGHFHFSQAGEEILHQEVRHFYKYRAIEKMVEEMTLEEAKPIIERISGNESVAYQIAWRDITAQAAGIELPEPIKKRHALLLELERVIHHLTDLGFIPNDAGFGAALAFCSKLAEEARRKMAELTGHRFGFGAVTFETSPIDTKAIKKWLDYLENEIAWFTDWIIDIPSLWDRFDTTGRLLPQKALKYDCVGVVARASGIAVDRRLDPFYIDHGFKMATQTNGDVGARFKIRLEEVRNSIAMMRNFLDVEPVSVDLPTPKDGSYTAYTESSLGELFMAIDIKEGKIERFFVRDSSFVNWQALHLMMPGNIIADFPLINKSCDLSYAGSDL
ncbi:hydrogenase large subunit [Hydrogenimonas cancrithermarum]|uniref:Hydrogenase large subunit n=1 Tax=Hydrogenimonas cancrithermarum TaxID=2993563 RepID=A0ABM8FK84_9BACT|nr:NADH-quinone oxidoreductase subunit C [Hydrogenimonas cancrithermarum]BDY11700.1 hydrogenase large subunit [Hydrogenimonas cancrithermarum]